MSFQQPLLNRPQISYSTASFTPWFQWRWAMTSASNSAKEEEDDEEIGTETSGIAAAPPPQTTRSWTTIPTKEQASQLLQTGGGSSFQPTTSESWKSAPPIVSENYQLSDTSLSSSSNKYKNATLKQPRQYASEQVMNETATITNDSDNSNTTTIMTGTISESPVSSLQSPKIARTEPTRTTVAVETLPADPSLDDPSSPIEEAKEERQPYTGGSVPQSLNVPDIFATEPFIQESSGRNESIEAKDLDTTFVMNMAQENEWNTTIRPDFVVKDDDASTETSTQSQNLQDRSSRNETIKSEDLEIVTLAKGESIEGKDLVSTVTEAMTQENEWNAAMRSDVVKDDDASAETSTQSQNLQDRSSRNETIKSEDLEIVTLAKGESSSMI